MKFYTFLNSSHLTHGTWKNIFIKVSTKKVALSFKMCVDTQKGFFCFPHRILYFTFLLKFYGNKHKNGNWKVSDLLKKVFDFQIKNISCGIYNVDIKSNGMLRLLFLILFGIQVFPLRSLCFKLRWLINVD